MLGCSSFHSADASSIVNSGSSNMALGVVGGVEEVGLVRCKIRVLSGGVMEY